MYGHVIAKFPWMGSLPHFLTHGERESSANKNINRSNYNDIKSGNHHH